jgi:small-conductance mechanosensitive channel
MTFQSFVTLLPSLIGALIVLLLGWLFARLIRSGSRKILTGLNRILERTFQRGLLASVRLPMGAATIFGELAYWVVIFVTLSVSARVAQLPVVSRWLNEIVVYLPSLLFGIATIVIGYVVSIVIAERVSESARAAKLPQNEILGYICQGIVLVVAAIIGLGQIGVDVSLFVALATVAIGAVLVGFSIAFGLGARDYVGNLIAARTIRNDLSIGLLVRIGDFEGEVLEITATQVALDTEHGRTLVPAGMIEEQVVTILSHSKAAEVQTS